VRVGVAQIDHAQVREIVPSTHCVLRFRQRRPVRGPGVQEVARALLDALQDADVSAWPPAWAVSDRPAELWAASRDGRMAFPLQPTERAGRWLALTCLRAPEH
jgi:hypothetical protein